MEPNDRTALYRSAFADRQDAGRRLGRALMRYKERHPVVLALPRGGVAVGFAIARALAAPLDVLFVRTLRAPRFPELELGALIDGPHPQRILDQSLIESLHVTQEYIESEVRVQRQIIDEHKQRYGDRPPLSLEKRTVILADDGSATDSTIRAALKALDLVGAGSKVLAVPAAPYAAARALAGAADDVVCLLLPADFHSIDFYYSDFTQTSDDEVSELLRRAGNPLGGAAPGNGIRWEL